ncbi:MAG: hypothetical protein E7363_05580 [Clostridiales bacterium]|nr:hypothetical protein [Clostridiales bacterium]
MNELFTKGEMIARAKELYLEERALKRLDGWFIAKEIETEKEGEFSHLPPEEKKARLLVEVLKNIPLSISDNAMFVGTQRDAFARSYALINPSFTVEGFSGYCDPLAIYGDIEPNEEFPAERIQKVKAQTAKSETVKKLNAVYKKAEQDTKEVLFFVEQVTGHVIPDFRPALKYGVDAIIKQAKEGGDTDFYKGAAIALSGVKVLIERYQAIISEHLTTATPTRAQELLKMQETLTAICGGGAKNMHQAMQLYLLLWQVMCMEQAPNPYAFSLGNVDRIFEPYRGDLTREEVKELFCHFLVFFNVGDRSWAISQNVLVGGRDERGNDLSNETTYAVMDAYYEMNLPQPILSVKLHANTPKKMYREMGKFFFTPGVLTPSLFNDDSLFEVLQKNGVDVKDIPDTAVAGCQEPLIMGQDSGNTTNTWLNLPKILETVLTGGYSLISGEKLTEETPYTLKDIRTAFYTALEKTLDRMVEAGNGCSVALSDWKVPFLSSFMGGLTYGADARDPKKQGTKYNGSGCLIHGLTVLADSFIAIDRFNEKYPENKELLVNALKNNFVGYEDLHAFLKEAPKFGNNIKEVDEEAKEIALRVSQMVRSRKNYLGNPFRPDYASPSTHLTYGYWVGATPDGRKSREMLGYGVDPLYGDASNGLGFRLLSNMRLPFAEFNGGYASHLGIDPKFFRAESLEDKGEAFYENVVRPLFFNEYQTGVNPFYLYVNVTTPETLRKVLANPQKYAPSGVYIMRIHGTFVNFLDLSPDIQQDIIKRLDLSSTSIA